MTLRDIPIAASNVARLAWAVVLLAKDVWVETITGRYR